MYSDNIKFGEQPDDIYDHVEQLEGDIQWYREEIESLKKTNEYLEKSFNIQKNTHGGLISHIEKRLFDLETYIHGPTRKPYDWEEK